MGAHTSAGTRSKLRKRAKTASKKSKFGSGKRFAAVKGSIAAGLNPSDLRPGQSREEAASGIAASIGRKKFGAKKFQRAAAAGRRRKRRA